MGGAEKFPAAQYLGNQAPGGNFDKVDFLTSCVRAVGPSAEFDGETRTSANFDWVRDLSGCPLKVRAKTDCLPSYCRDSQKHTSYCYNRFAEQLVGR